MNEIKISGIRSVKGTPTEEELFEFSMETNEEGNGATFSNEDGMFVHTDFEPKITINGLTVPIDRLCKMIELYKANKLVSLPDCKVGDTIYTDENHNGVFDLTVVGFYVDADNDAYPAYYCPCEERIEWLLEFWKTREEAIAARKGGVSCDGKRIY